MKNKNLSKFLSLVLRHKPEVIGLNMDKNGWVGGLYIAPGEEIKVTILADESEYGMPMPEEWEEVLATDEEAWERFQQLTPGRQRSILHLLGSAKREETRINRALLIAENLKMGACDIRDFMRK